MDQKQIIIKALASISGQKNILSIPKLFIDFMGSIEGGLFISQLLYWCDRGADKFGWIFKTYQDWYDEIRLTKYQVHKISGYCEKMGFLSTKIKKANGSPTVHYRINIGKFSEKMVDFISVMKDFEMENRQEKHFDQVYHDLISRDCAEAGLKNTAEMTKIFDS